MSIRQKRAVAIGLLLFLVGVGYTFAQPGEPVAPESLLPASSVVYVHLDGGLKHQEAWQKTAAHEALYKSGLMDVVAKLFSEIQNRTGGEQGIAGQVGGAVEHLRNHGLSLAVALDQPAGQPPKPWAILVVHEAARYEPGVLQLAMMASRGEIQFEQTEQQGRKVTHGTLPRTPGIEVGWWTEGEHLVVVAGMQAVDAALKVAGGEADITTNPLWGKYAAADADFDVAAAGWLDFSALLSAFGAMPVPGSRNETHPAGVSINEVAKIAGLDSLKTIAVRTGYRDRALWSVTKVDAPGPRRGLLSLMDQELMSISELPSLPAGSAGFSATSFEWTRAYDTLLEVGKKIEALFPPAQQGQIDAALAQAREKLGLDIRNDLLGPLGHVHCGYSDSNQAPLGLGIGLVVAVDDPAKLRASLEKVLAVVVQESQGQAALKKVEKQGQDVLMLEVQAGVFTPAFSVGDKWLAIGAVPQCVETFLLRQNGQLPRWEPDAEMQAALAAVPERFTAITVTDPRAAYRLVAGLAPYALGAAKAGLRQAQVLPPGFEMPVSVADLPPAEVVSRPLFPNVSVAGVDDDGVTYTSRSSLSGLPFAGAFDGGTAVTTTAVLTALLLPAVQQAREAARRTQSRNNLKQIMLAMHNYHDAFNHFPEGTYPSEKLDPDERLSWQATILPYLDQAPLYNRIDFDAGWEDEANREAMQTPLTVYRNPSSAEPQPEYASTHYVGMAGVGADGPMLPASNRKAGVFAYNRSTRIRDITDGTSNTVAVTDSSEPGPWGAGGRPTIRSLTTKPYINGPDGIGGPHQGGISAALCDGSVRFISDNIDPDVFEALMTISGGEVIGEF
jgi:hypothetical protein